ncbi:MAG: hypothetical protein Kow0069_05220 [Promethearchaeota archaeon]
MTKKKKAREPDDSSFTSLLQIDETDKQIIEILQEAPETTHSDIAKQVGKSQPAVGARIIKLKRKDLLCTQLGVNFRTVDVKLAKVELAARNVKAVLGKLEGCPVIINAFKISGENNLCALIAAPNLGLIDQIVDACLRSDPNVTSVTVNFIISSVRDFILPLAFGVERFREMGCGPDCGGVRASREVLERLQAEKLKREDYREILDDE